MQKPLFFCHIAQKIRTDIFFNDRSDDGIFRTCSSYVFILIRYCAHREIHGTFWISAENSMVQTAVRRHFCTPHTIMSFHTEHLVKLPFRSTMIFLRVNGPYGHFACPQAKKQNIA